MSRLIRIPALRHPVILVLIALLLLVLATPLQQLIMPPVSPPAPPQAVSWPTAVPTQAPTAVAMATPTIRSQTATSGTFRVYLPHLTRSDVAPDSIQSSSISAQDKPLCLEYRDIRITWYELGSCCNKSPDHPAYGITRSGLAVQWGMAAVQADTPLVPLGTTVMIKDLGPTYPMVVTDTGSETAFGSAWLDIYAPSEAVGYWLEQQIGLDGRSDVLVCPTQQP